MSATRVPVTPVQVFWGVCALAGLVAVAWPAAHVHGGAAFWRDVSGSWGARTASLDLLLLGVACVAFAVIEARRLGMRWPWIWVLLSLPLPGAFVVPLFFLLRERALLAQTSAPP